MLTLEFFYSWQYSEVPTEMQDTGLHGGFTKEGCTLKEQAITQTNNAVCNAELCVHYKKYRLVQILDTIPPKYRYKDSYKNHTSKITNITVLHVEVPHKYTRK